MVAATTSTLRLDEQHRYWFGDRTVPGVTEILSCVGTRRRIEAGNATHWRSISGGEFMRSENARGFGTAMHEYARLRLTGTPFAKIEYDEAMAPWVLGWERFRADHISAESIIHDSRPLIERSLYSPNLGYAGTVDWAMMLGTQPILVDWKTGAVMGHHKLQLAAYVGLLVAVTRIPGWSVWVVQINEDTYKVDAIDPKHLGLWQNKWTSIHNVYKTGE